ncbi:MAG: adenosylcobinamide-GDP ribazoletransferase, partial [bacterium]|nr:adenosylcobinamide-GDP ribazoletransferase [bacterium]
MSFFNAFRFLTIIPLPVKGPAKIEDMGHSLAFFPLVGLFIGLLLAAIYWALSFIFPLPVVTGL